MKKVILIFTFFPLVVFGQCISGNCDNGFGVWKYSTGDVYKGEWRNGEMEGIGVYNFKGAGDIYRGEWKSNKIHGFGTFTYASGAYYSGEFKDGKRNGLGTYVWEDGFGKTAYYIDDKSIKELCTFEK